LEGIYKTENKTVELATLYNKCVYGKDFGDNKDILSDKDLNDIEALLRNSSFKDEDQNRNNYWQKDLKTLKKN
jgi:hypothetical protein